MSRKVPILIVDDDPNLRKTLADILTVTGYEPIAVSDGRTALKKAKEHILAVALIDLKLEDMTGLELMGEIKARSPKTECIVITGFADLQSAMGAINAGAFAYLTKPIQGEELLAKIKAVQRKQAHAEREEALKQEYWRQATIDGLTGLYNRRYFDEQLVREIAISERYNRPVTLLMIDIDNFKAYNDAYGHPEGDAALQQTAALLLRGVRGADVVARFGGDEFALILREKHAQGALLIAERTRGLIKNAYPDEQNPILRARLTVSIGIAELPADAANSKELVARADQALYAAKTRGKNQCGLYNGQPPKDEFPIKAH